MIKKLLFFITGVTLFLSFFSISAHGFLGEDLGLDLYKSIDEGFEELEFKQYQYELSGQGQAGGGRIMEHVNSILETNGIECEIESIEDINLISGANNNQISEVYKKCKPEGAGNEKETSDGGLSPVYIANVINQVGQVKVSLENRAEEKSKQIYDIARIGLYSDGVSENSPFDLITDIEEIDRVIFSEELEYIGEDYGTLDFGNELDDYLSGNDRVANASYNREDEEEVGNDEENPDAETNNVGTAPDISDIIEQLDQDGNPIVTTEDGHLYACYIDKDESGLGDTTLNWLNNNIYTSGADIESLVENALTARGDLGDIDNRTRGRLGIPIESGDLEAKARFGPEGGHNKTYDTFGCDSFFCITVSLISRQQNLFGAGGGGETVSVESILERLDGHLYHISNTSLVQGKMTTNNFENNLVIKDLGEMLRGFGIQIQSKSVPILSVDNSEKESENNLNGGLTRPKNLIKEYYGNLGLEYDRSNDLDMFTGKIGAKKCINEAGEQSITTSVDCVNTYRDFQNAVAKDNEIISQSIDNKIIQSDLEDFYLQFTELERFTLAMEDFAISVAGNITQMEKIPEQKP